MSLYPPSYSTYVLMENLKQFQITHIQKHTLLSPWSSSSKIEHKHIRYLIYKFLHIHTDVHQKLNKNKVFGIPSSDLHLLNFRSLNHRANQEKLPEPPMIEWKNHDVHDAKNPPIHHCKPFFPRHKYLPCQITIPCVRKSLWLFILIYNVPQGVFFGPLW